MRRVSVAGALALAALAGPPAAGAEFIYRGRLVTIRVGRAPAPPPVVAAQPAPPPLVEPPPGVPLEIAPPAPPVPLPSSGPVPARPMTVSEFAGSFRPAGGNYKVTLLHPYSRCPVDVCFALPAGCPKVKVKTCLRQRIEFDYGGKDVEIVFYRNGRVKVDYDD